jgi:hypothetical protein
VNEGRFSSDVLSTEGLSKCSLAEVSAEGGSMYTVNPNIFATLKGHHFPLSQLKQPASLPLENHIQPQQHHFGFLPMSSAKSGKMSARNFNFLFNISIYLVNKFFVVNHFNEPISLFNVDYGKRLAEASIHHCKVAAKTLTSQW